jgi:hypothetical protein
VAGVLVEVQAPEELPAVDVVVKAPAPEELPLVEAHVSEQRPLKQAKLGRFFKAPADRTAEDMGFAIVQAINSRHE